MSTVHIEEATDSSSPTTDTTSTPIVTEAKDKLQSTTKQHEWKVGDLLDAKDTVQKWMEARILSIDEEKVRATNNQEIPCIDCLLIIDCFIDDLLPHAVFKLSQICRSVVCFSSLSHVVHLLNRVFI